MFAPAVKALVTRTVVSARIVVPATAPRTANVPCAAYCDAGTASHVTAASSVAPSLS